MPIPVIATTAYHNRSLNPVSKVLNVTIYSVVEIDDIEYLSEYDAAAAQFDPWPDGGAYLKVSLTDKNPDNNPGDLEKKHDETRTFIGNLAQFTANTLSAAGLPVVPASDPVDQPTGDNVDFYGPNDTMQGDRREYEFRFRTNNPAAVTILMLAQADASAFMAAQYPEGRTDLLDG